MRFVTLLILLLVSQSGWTEYLAFSVSEDGKRPLPENIDGIDAEDLLNIEWGTFVGGKSRLGVLEVDNTSGAGSFTIESGGATVDFGGYGTQVPMNGIEAIVTDTLNRTGRFRLVERQALGDVLGEQDLAASGRVAKPSGAATGNVLGAQFLVQVVVTDYESDVKESSKGIGGFLSRAAGLPSVGGVGVKSGQGRVGLNFRLIDAETSEVMFTKQIESIIKESGLTFGGGGAIGDLGLGGFMDDYSRTPIGQAVIAGINKGVFDLVKAIGSQAASGSIVKAEGEQVWLNLGQDVVAVGEKLNIMRKGEELIDPDTGISLGSSDTMLGTVEVVQVQPQFSIAKTVSMSGAPARGDKALSLKPAATTEFASDWKKN
jgi:curli biogenesis system outer membrane secretion channel CsgG